MLSPEDGKLGLSMTGDLPTAEFVAAKIDVSHEPRIFSLEQEIISKAQLPDNAMTI